MSSTGLILITGASGQVGFRTLGIALERGHRIRLALRSQKRFDAVKSALKEHYPSVDASKIEYIEVPDLATPGAYDAATKGVTGVIHIASPIITDDLSLKPELYHEYFMEPAVKGTLGMLESAKKSGTVKRVVITSSGVAIMPFAEIAGAAPQKGPATPDNRVPTDQGPYEFGEFQAYAASKVAALNEAAAWQEREKPQFDIVHLNPTFVQGRDDLFTDVPVPGIAAVILTIALGKQWPFPMGGSSVHIDDVARVHVDALKPEIPADTYILNLTEDGGQTGPDWATVPAIVQKNFPEEVKSGLLKPQESNASTVPLMVDGSKTEKVFGFKYLSLEEQVKSVVGQYVELVNKHNKA